MSSSRLCITTATAPVSFHEHEILHGHPDAVILQSIEGMHTERKSVVAHEISARISLLYEQCDVAVRGLVAVAERHWTVIDLSKIHTAAYTTTEIL